MNRSVIESIRSIRSQVHDFRFSASPLVSGRWVIESTGTLRNGDPYIVSILIMRPDWFDAYFAHVLNDWSRMINARPDEAFQ